MNNGRTSKRETVYSDGRPSEIRYITVYDRYDDKNYSTKELEKIKHGWFLTRMRNIINDHNMPPSKNCTYCNHRSNIISKYPSLFGWTSWNDENISRYCSGCNELLTFKHVIHSVR